MPPLDELVAQLERLFRVGVTLAVTYLVAVWVATIWWVFRDIHSRSTDRWLQTAATLLVILLNFPGLLIYLILRPQLTLAEAYTEGLEEEAWQRAVGEGRSCPACQQTIEPDYLFCPWCQARLRRACPRCDRLIFLRWRLCPYCGANASAGTTALPAPNTQARD